MKKYERKLGELHRSAFPNAIRATLNDAAFEMKKNNLHTSAARNFKYTRSKTFFKRFSAVNKAKGWKINEMYSEVGMLDMGQKSAKTAIDNMHLHETGGNVKKGAIYLKGSRTSKNFGKLVRKVNYLKKENHVKSGNYVKKAFVALKENKLMKQGDYLIKVNKITKGKKLRINTSFIAKERENTRISPNKFISKAAEVTQRKIRSNFQKNAEYQIQKRLNR